MFFQCPVPGCPGTAAERFGLREHFMFRHPEDTIIIEEEGALQRCGKCCMFLTGRTNVAKHQTSEICQKGSSQREKREEDATRKQAGEIIFYINGREIENVPEFKYLGRWLAKSDNDLKAVQANIQKARARWSGFSRVLTRKGANRKVMSVFYRTIIQSVLLFGSETWTLTQRQMQLIASFHNQCARSITRRWNRQDEDGEWHCPDMKETMRLAFLLPIQDYISSRKRNYKPYAANRAIYRKCRRAARNPSTSHKVVWWDP
jgi:hypothetical protein